MPEIDGLEVLRRLRERPGDRQMPVLVITGTEHARSAMELGASGYLTKPLEVTEVARVVQRLVARR
jgi:CheY-like chemotaxis protein